MIGGSEHQLRQPPLTARARASVLKAAQVLVHCWGFSNARMAFSRVAPGPRDPSRRRTKTGSERVRENRTRTATGQSRRSISLRGAFFAFFANTSLGVVEDHLADANRRRRDFHQSSSRSTRTRSTSGASGRETHGHVRARRAHVGEVVGPADCTQCRCRASFADDLPW